MTDTIDPLAPINTIHAQREMWTGNIAIHMAAKSGGKMAVVQPLTLKTTTPGELMYPSMVLDVTAAQALMNELWHVGLRPSEGTGSAGSLAATERHLKDMQAFARGLLKKTGVDLGDLTP